MTNRSPGLFVVIEGPSGVGKSTLMSALRGRLAAAQPSEVFATKEPTQSPIGTLAREIADHVRGESLACLVAADRYQHLESLVRPHLARGAIVLCDRYVPSSLVLQVLDGVDEEFVDTLNGHTDVPNLYIFLEDSRRRSRERSFDRQDRDRFHFELDAESEASRYIAVAARLSSSGAPVLSIDVGDRSEEQVADLAMGRVMELIALTQQ